MAREKKFARVEKGGVGEEPFLQKVSTEYEEANQAEEIPDFRFQKERSFMGGVYYSR